MTNDTEKTGGEFTNGQPYTALSGELVATSIALMLQVIALRPEVQAFGNRLLLAYDADQAHITVGLQLKDGTVAIVEKIAVDPGDPRTFGQSLLDLPIEAAQTH